MRCGAHAFDADGRRSSPHLVSAHAPTTAMDRWTRERALNDAVKAVGMPTRPHVSTDRFDSEIRAPK